MKANWSEKNSLQLYSTVEIHTHTRTHEHLAIQVRVSLEVQKKGRTGN